jgi:hypothetical protein
MITEVDKYRGWEISFDTESEQFSAYSSIYDNEIKKASYATIKKYIDDFIKDNNHFKPFEVWYKPGSEKGILTIIGIRKDMAFVAENKDGKKFQISKYEEDSIIIPSEKTKAVYEEYYRLKRIAVQANKIASEYLEKNLTEPTIKQYKQSL